MRDAMAFALQSAQGIRIITILDIVRYKSSTSSSRSLCRRASLNSCFLSSIHHPKKQRGPSETHAVWTSGTGE